MKRRSGRIFDEEGVVRRPVRIALAVCILAALCLGAGFLYGHSPLENVWLVCVLYRLTGYYCPGCGAGRASYCILHGRFHEAFLYNPLYCILLIPIGIYIAAAAVQWLATGRETVTRRIPERVLYLLFALIVVYGIVRNIDVYPFNCLVPGGLR